MNRRPWLWNLTIVGLAMLAAFTAPPFHAQEQAGAKPEQQQPAKQEGSPQEKEQAVEQILRQQEALITGQGFTYNPAGRRDPFRSPFGVQGPSGGERPPGIAGMLIAELDLTGIVADSRDGDVAVVMGSDNKGYFLRVGDQVYDGTVIAIDSKQGTVTFRQQVDDPRLIKPYRDIVKRLVPLEDEESGDE